MAQCWEKGQLDYYSNFLFFQVGGPLGRPTSDKDRGQSIKKPEDNIKEEKDLKTGFRYLVKC